MRYSIIMPWSIQWIGPEALFSNCPCVRAYVRTYRPSIDASYCCTQSAVDRTSETKTSGQQKTCCRSLTKFIMCHYWHCPHSMKSLVYETVSIRLFVRLSVRRAAACGGFAAGGPASRRYRSIAARPAPQQHWAQQRMWVIIVPRFQGK